MSVERVAVECQDCGETIGNFMPDEVRAKLATGDYIQGVRLTQGKNSQGDEALDVYRRKVLGICRTCQRAYAADVTGGDPALTNIEYRRYLLDRGAADPEVDAKLAALAEAWQA